MGSRSRCRGSPAGHTVVRLLPSHLRSTRSHFMKTYVIRRRDGWADGAELEKAAARSTSVGDEMPDDVRWIRSYVVQEVGGHLGTVCIYQASSPEAIRDHAAKAGLPADEIFEVADTVIVRPDPEAA